MAQANERGAVKSFVTPLAGDILFFERVDETMPKNQAFEYGTPHPNPVLWPKHKLVYVSPAPKDPHGDQYRYYACDREDQDLYNFEFTAADMGGTKFDAVVRSYVTPRDTFDPLSPAIGSVMPDSPEGKFTGVFILAEKAEQKTGVEELDSIYVGEKHLYVRRDTIRVIGYDEHNGRPLTKETNLYYWNEPMPGMSDSSDGVVTMAELMLDPTNPFWGIQPNGTKVTGEQLSTNWYVVETEMIVAVEGDGLVHQYYTNENYYWPPVLREVEFMDWERKPSQQAIAKAEKEGEQAPISGGFDIFPRLYFSPEAYNGPCLCHVEVYWQPSQFTIDAVIPMQPQRVYYSCPFYNVNANEALHNGWGFECEIRDEDDENYKMNTGSTRTFAPTQPYQEWPTEIIGFDDQNPYKGGYLRTKKTFYPPTYNHVPTPEWVGQQIPEVAAITATEETLVDTTFFTANVIFNPASPHLCYVRVSTNPKFSSNVVYMYAVNGGGGNWSVVVDSLLPGTTYYYQAQGCYYAEMEDDLGNPIGFAYKWTPISNTITAVTLDDSSSS